MSENIRKMYVYLVLVYDSFEGIPTEMRVDSCYILSQDADKRKNRLLKHRSLDDRSEKSVHVIRKHINGIRQFMNLPGIGYKRQQWGYMTKTFVRVGLHH